MPEREHTDRQALDAMWGRSVIEPIAQVPSIRWYRRLYNWLKVEVFWAPIESPSEDGPILHRIEIHEKAVRGARRLHKLSREEQTQILVVTAMLLGLEDTWAPRRRTQRATR
jgi:hypothetical protein